MSPVLSNSLRHHLQTSRLDITALLSYGYASTRPYAFARTSSTT